MEPFLTPLRMTAKDRGSIYFASVLAPLDLRTEFAPISVIRIPHRLGSIAHRFRVSIPFRFGNRRIRRTRRADDIPLPGALYECVETAEVVRYVESGILVPGVRVRHFVTDQRGFPVNPDTNVGDF